MTLKNSTSLPSGLLFIGFYLLLACTLALPASARSQRSHKAAASVSVNAYTTVLRGRASWYGREHQGMRTSSGERFNRFKFTCAHKTLPFGTRLRVTNVRTGKAVVVRVSDRGPFRHQRILDLAEAAARPLGIVEQGAANVLAQVVPATTPLGPAKAIAAPHLLAMQAADPTPAAAFATYELPSAADSAAVVAASDLPATAAALPLAAGGLPTPQSATRFLVQAGTFADTLNAQAMRSQLLALYPTLAVEIREELLAGRSLQRVLIGQFDTWLAAETVRRRLQSKGVASLVRQVPSQPTVAMAVPATESAASR